MTTTKIVQTKTSSPHTSESRLELESLHSETIFCDMISPDEWKSSLPLVFQQDDIHLLNNSPNSSSNSIENLVLQLESSQETQNVSTESQETMDEVFIASKPDNENIESASTVMYCEMMDDSEHDEYLQSSDSLTFQSKQTTASDVLSLKKSPSKCKMVQKNQKKISNLETPASNGQKKTNDSGASKAQSLESIPVKTPAASEIIPKSRCELDKTIQTSINEKTASSQTIQKLTGRLAKVIHCNTTDGVVILKKATSTISTLRKQACDLMSTYSQLKFQNDELIHKQNQLHAVEQSHQVLNDEYFEESSDQKFPLTIEVLIPSADSKEAFDSAPLYHHIPIEDGLIPVISENESHSSEDITEEPYEELYDARPNFDPMLMPSEQSICLDKKPVCELGCICSSLNTGKIEGNHCKNPNCMLEPTCQQPEDPSHIPSTVNTILTKKDLVDGDKNQTPNVQADQDDTDNTTQNCPRLPYETRSKETSKPLPLRKTVKKLRSSIQNRKKNQQPIISDLVTDRKLQQTCYVRLVKLDSKTLKEKLAALEDVKLHSECCVRLQRLKVKRNQPVYCMDHKLRQCICLAPTKTG